MNHQKQAGAETTLQWLGHASFRIRYKGLVIYLDPWKLPGEPQDAAIILVSHGSRFPAIGATSSANARTPRDSRAWPAAA